MFTKPTKFQSSFDLDTIIERLSYDDPTIPSRKSQETFGRAHNYERIEFGLTSLTRLSPN